MFRAPHKAAALPVALSEPTVAAALVRLQAQTATAIAPHSPAAVLRLQAAAVAPPIQAAAMVAAATEVAASLVVVAAEVAATEVEASLVAAAAEVAAMAAVAVAEVLVAVDKTDKIKR